MKQINPTLFARLLNGIELFVILLVLLIALILQFVLNELPCPLCLLQRLGFFGIAFGILMNLWYGLRSSHYAIILFSALYTSFVALRQVALHVVTPGPGYGAPFLGFHLYTWCFIVAMCIIIATAFLLTLDKQYQQSVWEQRKQFRWIGNFLGGVLAILLIVNIISVILECGFHQCPDNPTQYTELP